MARLSLSKIGAPAGSPIYRLNEDIAKIAITIEKTETILPINMPLKLMCGLFLLDK